MGTIQPEASAAGMKSLGKTKPRSGWFQRTKRLDGSNSARLEVNDRLIEENELVLHPLLAKLSSDLGSFEDRAM